MKVTVVGAGSVGRSIARELVSAGRDVVIIDREPGAMKVASVPEADWILGDACEMPTLVRADVANADVVVAATGDDKVNLVVSLLCKTEFGVERIVARVNNPKNEWFFDDLWGVDVAVSTPRIMTAMVEDAVADGDLITAIRFHSSGATLRQATLPEDAPIVGMTVGDVLLPPTITINAIVRGGMPVQADADLLIEAGDQIFVLCAADADGDLELLKEMLKSVD